MGFKSIVVLFCLLVSVLAEDKYTTKYDNINWEEIVENRRLLVAYIDCILDRGKCTPEGKEFKDHIQDALETGCTKCTETQENGVTIIINHMVSKERGLWKEVTDKYDPQGIWRDKYEDRAKAKGIIIPKD